MSKLMTMEEWKKQATTKDTAPLDMNVFEPMLNGCLLYTSPSPRD